MVIPGTSILFGGSRAGNLPVGGSRGGQPGRLVRARMVLRARMFHGMFHVEMSAGDAGAEIGRRGLAWASSWACVQRGRFGGVSVFERRRAARERRAPP